MSIADHYGDGQVEREDMCEAVATWQALLNDESLIAERFHEYDTDQSGGLNETQLAEVLKDLNGGVAVPPEEVKQVFTQADGKGPKQVEDGVINEAELKVAVAVRSQTSSAPDVSALRCLLPQVWYCSASEKASQKSSSMCTIL